MRALIGLLSVCSLLGACSTSPYGRSHLVAPQSLGEAYSEVNMRLQLVVVPDAAGKCAASECDANKEFEVRVARLGVRLAGEAFDTYPRLRERVRRFEFVIARKGEPGTLSNASGTVVIFSGTRALEISDPALAFVLAREMGHVIGQHHSENTATKVIVSVLAQLLLPVTGIAHALALLPGVSSAATASAASASTTMAATTAASLLGSNAVIARYRPTQVDEADRIALILLARTGYEPQDTAEALAAMKPRRNGSSNWPQELRASSDHVAQIAQGPRPDKARLAELAASAPLKLTDAIDVPSAGASAAHPPARMP